MKTNYPVNGSGKTRFNREKSKGESWTDLRNDFESKHGVKFNRESQSHDGVSKKGSKDLE